MNKFFYFIAATLVAVSFASCEQNKPSQPKDDDDESPKEPTYYHKDPVDGCLPGLFAVSETQQVYFSKGNLWYSKLNFETRWEFAVQQYRVLGESNLNIEDMPSFSAIDLFNWNTANDPTRHEADDYAGDFEDWGDKPIYNGGNTEGLWRTLTGDEWLYLFHGRPNAEQLFGHGCIAENEIDTVNGIFLFPDNWEEIKPEDFEFHSCADMGMVWGKQDGVVAEGYFQSLFYNGYKQNVYDMDMWQKLEDLGVVFLPAAGLRTWKQDTYIVSLDFINTFGYYWSASAAGDRSAYNLVFGWFMLCPKSFNGPHYGSAVRLVR